MTIIPKRSYNVLTTCKAVFRDVGDYWLTTGNLRTTKPQSPAQGFHRDTLLYPVLQYQPATSPSLIVTLLVSMTDATVANGATRVILSSQNGRLLNTIGGPGRASRAKRWGHAGNPSAAAARWWEAYESGTEYKTNATNFLHKMLASCS
ncbi:hypothetical protein AN9254.2 [Aspergillus nidulans FGSC A4]|uniref:Iron/alpha-ketoglutarate-dependent dioxygenase ausU n=1 Tax=Emericella nidulans (strain FGSC A4 / ATCC 38163 / CBS 112.46 / NRRL 194 / M139) TaxID=227321 RepID=AUSU_EMENI|nr:hypothetical protein [Aspergillus nidulans FGSC A4]A0A1U8QGE6.1 RecName: Full=Iron/alpha-ketoglutarate-dependent dioxygenase ausU; AltName: Full=Austinoid biosynthesis clusters protein U [Aspergillus nidulans FGSC A4]EAA66321.1 hypothetical protein AN9254.2 [Aspergillus nidulans FGSC A4]CBF87254.1 TPA: conserved hypothetical protein [Aspergillus nidulans FGSC A4]|eukprot:XP_682523.1 hypothetical protein AN9254.2 [Aspergillus nidulans FGSC A4]